jgi:penicillin-binding protein 2
VWFLAFAPYDHPKYALAVMIEGGKSGGGVAAPMASSILEKIFALDHGYNPGLKSLSPAIGNFKMFDAVNPAKDEELQAASDANEANTHQPDDNSDDQVRRSSRAKAEPDIRPEPDSERAVAQRGTQQRQQQQPQRHSIFDIFKRQPAAPGGSPQQKRHFLWF